MIVSAGGVGGNLEDRWEVSAAGPGGGAVVSDGDLLPGLPLRRRSLFEDVMDGPFVFCVNFLELLGEG